MQHRAVNYYRTTVGFIFVNGYGVGTVIQADILEIHNVVENNYQCDAMELLEKHKALT